MTESPRVTLGIATYNRDTYLAEAIDSCLGQDYESLEVLVVVDGSTNPGIDAVLDRYASHSRLRVVRHERNQGIAAAYNTFVSAGRGELIAMLGDDDVALPGRIRRQVELFDRFPDTGVVHGDGTIIDGASRQAGLWPSRDFSGSQLLHAFFFSHNHLVDPTRMVHRRVYDEVGGYNGRYPLANDLDFWVRAATRFKFRHCAGGPLSAIRRHGANASDELAGRAAEIADVEAILEAALHRLSLRGLVPEVDWALLDPVQAERDALLRLAEGLERRQLPLIRLAAKVRGRAEALPEPAPPAPRSAAPGKPRKLMITAFGWNDPGGGTTVPRLAAKELARRGWEVTVFHAAVRPTASQVPYEVVEWEEDNVRLIGVHNRHHGLFDLGNPLRELDDAPITAAFAAALDRLRPDVVHFHNLHNLGAALIDQAAVRGLPAFFTTHNYWLICPRAYLLTGQGAICAGPGDGTRCAACTGSHDQAGHHQRLAAIRSRVHSGLKRVLAVSDAVRHALVSSGYSPEMIDIVRQAMPHEGEIWQAVGRNRMPGQRNGQLTVAFLGSAYPHKGPQLLAEAAQRTQAPMRVQIIGEVQPQFAEHLQALDRRGVVELHGAFSPSELGELLAGIDVAVLPSMWWDCAPLAAAECLAARVPLVLPRLGGLPEAIRDGIDGLVFKGLDAEDLARQLDRLAGEPGLLERLQANIQEPRAFAAYVDELESYYDGEHESSSHGPREPAAVAVRWKGDHGLPTSLSIINDEVSSRLQGPVQRVDRGERSLDAPLPHPADVEVHHEWPPDFGVPPSGRLATIVPWEFGAVPRQWLPQITQNVDELWVPSDFVRSMYVDSGIAPQRVHVIPNGVDLDIFRPSEAPRAESAATRFLYVGGIAQRKGIDLLLEGWDRAFADRDDVLLVIKAAMAGGAYGGPNQALRQRAAAERRPRIDLIEDDLDTAQLAELYRSCDVFVLPYRGEGFAMPVLEAMASGLPVIVTAGGPTDEFCPEAAGWRIRSGRKETPVAALGDLTPDGTPWMLEPELDHLVELLREAAAASSDALAAKGSVGRNAAERYSWDAVADQYSQRIAALAALPARHADIPIEPFPFAEGVDLRVLATPAWRGQDRLAELLRDWVGATTPATSACLYLLADPATAGEPEQIEAFVIAAAENAGVELDGCADINVLIEPFRSDRDQRLNHSVDAYAPLHPGCAGHLRLAVKTGSAIVQIGGDDLAKLVGMVAIR
ncbi:MAG TPA: glycosyltransferase [Solirubrobacteraceae bacterium]|jgi:glycosyltransferase involved in cell wall biosynthesis|nr:glycosyltransferase [Solirubrobacteraceae bacterium]